MSEIGKPWPKEQIQPASVFVNRLYWNKVTLTVLWLLSHNSSKDEKLQQRLYVYHLAFYRSLLIAALCHIQEPLFLKRHHREQKDTPPTKKTPALSISNMTHVQNTSKKLSKTDDWIFKQWVKDLNRHFTKQISQMANSYERVLNSFSHQQLQCNTTPPQVHQQIKTRQTEDFQATVRKQRIRIPVCGLWECRLSSHSGKLACSAHPVTQPQNQHKLLHLPNDIHKNIPSSTIYNSPELEIIPKAHQWQNG